ncbi:MAG: hypothetical protein KDI82_15725, partial [Gammaproteobacteria bacterium]|nr:hypothetical protein [Gammaproteobacteria bacterium]
AENGSAMPCWRNNPNWLSELFRTAVLGKQRKVTRVRSTERNQKSIPRASAINSKTENQKPNSHPT